MANSIKLDWRNQEIFYVPATEVEFITEDKTEGVVFESSIGEKTFSELEDENLELKIALEEAYEIIEAKERLEDVNIERHFGPSY